MPEGRLRVFVIAHEISASFDNLEDAIKITKKMCSSGSLAGKEAIVIPECMVMKFKIPIR